MLCLSVLPPFSFFSWLLDALLQPAGDFFASRAESSLVVVFPVQHEASWRSHVDTFWNLDGRGSDIRRSWAKNSLVLVGEVGGYVLLHGLTVLVLSFEEGNGGVEGSHAVVFDLVHRHKSCPDLFCTPGSSDCGELVTLHQPYYQAFCLFIMHFHSIHSLVCLGHGGGGGSGWLRCHVPSGSLECLIGEMTLSSFGG
ncbi:hypothetical protein BS47DRAFT_1368739 [Hydnum rufescens UP504]|uniref:Secreted protein n=1 Tax=Hydnum rufescens UP504 TaxID=1448309 RepID=A0A9P6AF01_9AGAM|nr:hypothetical protein BS47DRAFT_1368739 [Hydnum rufescens UP504]